MLKGGTKAEDHGFKRRGPGCAGGSVPGGRCGCTGVFIRGGRLIGRDHFYLRISKGETKAEILDSFIKQYYAGTPFYSGRTDAPGRTGRTGITGGMAEYKAGTESHDQNPEERDKRKISRTGREKMHSLY